MTQHNVKGVISVATIAIGFSATAIMGWMGWESITTIEHGQKLASQEKWQEIYGRKIDWLVEKNGANPQAIEMFYQPKHITEK